MKDQDSIFFKNFSILLGALVGLTIILIVVGYLVHNSLFAGKETVTDRNAIEQALEPVAKVNTGEVIEESSDGGDNTADTQTNNNQAEAQVAGAFDGSLDGAMIYQNVCFACHATGAANAPKLEATAWTDRMEKGVDGLVTSAINGLGAMPPKGGRPDLTDEQMKAVVEFMVKDFQ